MKESIDNEIVVFNDSYLIKIKEKRKEFKLNLITAIGIGNICRVEELLFPGPYYDTEDKVFEGSCYVIMLLKYY